MWWGWLADPFILAHRSRRQGLRAEATKRGLILLTCGTYGNVIRILVPLTASDALLDEGLAIIGASLEAAIAPR